MKFFELPKFAGIVVDLPRSIIDQIDDSDPNITTEFGDPQYFYVPRSPSTYVYLLNDRVEGQFDFENMVDMGEGFYEEILSLGEDDDHDDFINFCRENGFDGGEDSDELYNLWADRQPVVE